MSPESANDWLERARRNAARFAGLLEGDAADLEKNQANDAQTVAKIRQIQSVLGRIIAGLNDQEHVSEKEESDRA